MFQSRGVILFVSPFDIAKLNSKLAIFGTNYSRIDLVKFVEDRLSKNFQADHIPSNFFKGCLAQILLGPIYDA